MAGKAIKTELGRIWDWRVALAMCLVSLSRLLFAHPAVDSISQAIRHPQIFMPLLAVAAFALFLWYSNRKSRNQKERLKHKPGRSASSGSNRRH